jgi:hypothetical protein
MGFLRSVRKIAKSDYELRHVCPSVRVEQLGSHWKDFHEIGYLGFFRKSVEKIQVSLKSDKNNSTLHEGQYTFSIIYRSVLPRMKNISEREVVQKLETQFYVQ